jgi:hypothetical protein
MAFLKLIQIVGKMVRIQIRNGITALDSESYVPNFETKDESKTVGTKKFSNTAVS